MTALASTRPRSLGATTVVRRVWDRRVAAFALALVPTVLLGSVDGGYFPPTWGWAALGFAWVALLALVLGETVSAPRWGLAWLSGVVVLAIWAGASIAWSSDQTRSVLDTQRTLVYVAAAAAVLLIARLRTIPHLLAGLALGFAGVAAYALATRLFPERLGAFDPISGYRLAEPVGYWNALGLAAAMGTLLALGFAARAQAVMARAASAAAVVVLVPTIYFTFGRGPWIALAVGFVAAVAFDPRRLQFVATSLVAAPAPALAVFVASRSDALTHLGADLDDASRQGHRLALVIVALAAANAVVVAAFALASRRIDVPQALRVGAGVALAAFALVLIALTVARFGGPVSLARDAVDAFERPAPATGDDLNRRLFSFSGSGRPELWRAAWRGYESNSTWGSGAGTYELSWQRYRAIPAQARDAHNLYLETLAELGPVGLATLAVVLLLPYAAAWRARAAPLAVGAVGAYTAYVVHASVDWDWEMPVVTVGALFCGGAIFAGASKEPKPLAVDVRITLGAVCAAVASFALIGLVGNSAVAASEEAARESRWPEAVDEAKKAAGWAPWSSEPWRVRGEAELGRGNLAGAATSFRTAVGSSPDDWHLWFQLALATDGRERERALERAESLNPLSPQLTEFRRSLRR